MRGRSLLDVVETFKSRMLQAWTAEWSLPIDEVFIPIRLPRRHVEATGGVAERWLLKAARSAAVKWRNEVCGFRSGRVQRVAVAGAQLPQLLLIGVPRVLHVTARYCGRVQGGAFCFRHGLCDARGFEIVHFVSQVYFNPQPALPIYPAIQLNASGYSGAAYQIDSEFPPIEVNDSGVFKPEPDAESEKNPHCSATVS